MSEFMIYITLEVIAVFCLIAGLIKPSIFSKYLKGEISRKKILYIFGTAALAIPLINGMIMSSRNEAALNIPVSEQQRDYALLKDESFETPSTAKVIWSILITSNVTKDRLVALANEIYAQADAIKFQRHSEAMVIDIKIYMSKQHAESDPKQWIAWVSKSGGVSTPDFRYDDGQIKQLGAKPENKFGLSEERRKKIWRDMILVEDRAEQEALLKYPDPRGQKDQAFSKRQKLSAKLMQAYRNDLAKEVGLTPEQLRLIGDEGQSKSWPFPPASK